MTNVLVKSKTTGLTGYYPENHVALDPDLEIAEESVCVDCVVEQPVPVDETPSEVEVETEPETKTNRKVKTYGR